MEKMIGVINDNLNSVIEGIRTHREEVESKLNEVNAEIDKKVRDASTYRTQVDDARSSIQSLETEIATLKADLKELKDKFGSRNFVEIVNVADREINAKIAEKQDEVTRQADIIKNVTADANGLKDVLVRLKAKKVNIEESLKNAKILESFYEQRLTDIINFSNAHVKDLNLYVKDKDAIEKDLKDIDIEQALSSVDGSIFEEIDNISTKTPTEEEAQDALDNIVILDDEDEEEKEQELTRTQKLDDVISAANEILKGTKKEEDSEETLEILDTPPIYATPVPFRQPEIVEAEKVDKEVRLPEEPIVLDTSFEALKDKTIEPVKPVEERKPEPFKPADDRENYINFNDILDKALKDAEAQIEPNQEAIPFEEVFKDEVVEERKPEPVEPKKEEVKEEVKEEPKKEQSLNDLNPGGVEELKIPDKEYVRKAFKELNLDAGRFVDSSLEKLVPVFNKDNTSKFVEVLGKHGIDNQVIYENVDVLIKVTPQNLDKILNTLELTGASSEAIAFMYKFFDKVNISKLEMAIVPGENKELTHVLFDAIPFFTTDNLVERLGLTKQEEYILKDKTTKEEFKRMCMFSDVVFANYVTLRNLGINNLKDCITKRPKRFLWNPDRFNAMLDKYDTDDLIRCINKNSAVLDKL